MPLTFKELHWAKDIRVQQYLQPKTLEEALQMLQDYGGRARVIAGGTDVIPQLRRRDIELEALVDITGLPDMADIEQDGDRIILGGLITHAQVASSQLIKARAGLLSEGAVSVSSPQIRNIATVAGNLISGQPAADASIPLLALDARITIASGEGERVVPLSEFFLDLGKTALDPGREILTRIEFQSLGSDQGGAYLRLSKRKALSLPMLVCAVKVTVNKNKDTISETAIALGPVAPTPFRDRPTEDALRGAPIRLTTITEAAEGASASCSPRDSLLRGSCDYRQEMVKVFVKRGLVRALKQAGCTLE
jgi:CO/xanthine dehydrogenase FAD-binding subunit